MKDIRSYWDLRSKNPAKAEKILRELIAEAEASKDHLQLLQHLDVLAQDLNRAERYMEAAEVYVQICKYNKYSEEGDYRRYQFCAQNATDAANCYWRAKCYKSARQHCQLAIREFKIAAKLAKAKAVTSLTVDSSKNPFRKAVEKLKLIVSPNRKWQYHQHHLVRASERLKEASERVKFVESLIRTGKHQQLGKNHMLWSPYCCCYYV